MTKKPEANIWNLCGENKSIVAETQNASSKYYYPLYHSPENTQ